MTMGEKVFMSPNNGQLIIGVPLFTRQCQETDEYKILIQVESDKPVAYAIDCGPEIEVIHFFNAEWVESKLICLGDL